MGEDKGEGGLGRLSLPSGEFSLQTPPTALPNFRDMNVVSLYEL